MLLDIVIKLPMYTSMQNWAGFWIAIPCLAN